MSNTINWGEIYSSSWFGKVDADNGWGNVYHLKKPKNT